MLVGVQGRLRFVGVESLSPREENRGQHRAPVKKTLNQEPVEEPGLDAAGVWCERCVLFSDKQSTGAVFFKKYQTGGKKTSRRS